MNIQSVCLIVSNARISGTIDVIGLDSNLFLIGSYNMIFTIFHCCSARFLGPHMRCVVGSLSKLKYNMSS